MIFGALSRLLGSGRVNWRKGQINAHHREQEWQVRRGLAAELTNMKACRKTIDELKREAAEMISAAPWAKDLTTDERKRLQELERENRELRRTYPCWRRDSMI